LFVESFNTHEAFVRSIMNITGEGVTIQ